MPEVEVAVVGGSSDHKVVVFTGRLGGRLAPDSERKFVKDFSTANDESVLDYLDFAHYFADSDVNFPSNNFQAICHFCNGSFIPVKAKNLGRDQTHGSIAILFIYYARQKGLKNT